MQKFRTTFLLLTKISENPENYSEKKKREEKYLVQKYEEVQRGPFLHAPTPHGGKSQQMMIETVRPLDDKMEYTAQKLLE